MGTVARVAVIAGVDTDHRNLVEHVVVKANGVSFAVNTFGWQTGAGETVAVDV